MADANRGGMHELVEANTDLKIKYYKICINEKRGQIKSLESTIERMKSVEIKKTELSVEVNKRELAQMENDLKELEKKINAVNIEKK